MILPSTARWSCSKASCAFPDAGHRSKAQSAGGRKGAAASLGPVPVEGSLVWLRRRKDKDGQPLVTEPQFAAGERLGADYWRAQMSPRVTADWSGNVAGRRMRRSAPGTGMEIGDAVIAARERVNRALTAVGPELAGILLDVCCREVGLEAAGHAAGWPQRAAKVVLQLALTRLARHYGLISPEHPFHGRMRHWGDEDYCPGSTPGARVPVCEISSSFAARLGDISETKGH